jgi:hypothetical protein
VRQPKAHHARAGLESRALFFAGDYWFCVAMEAQTTQRHVSVRVKAMNPFLSSASFILI